MSNLPHAARFYIHSGSLSRLVVLGGLKSVDRLAVNTSTGRDLEDLNLGKARLEVGFPLCDKHGVVDPLKLRDGGLKGAD